LSIYLTQPGPCIFDKELLQQQPQGIVAYCCEYTFSQVCISAVLYIIDPSAVSTFCSYIDVTAGKWALYSSFHGALATNARER
jgi:hypothetical protein